MKLFCRIVIGKYCMEWIDWLPKRNIIWNRGVNLHIPHRSMCLYTRLPNRCTCFQNPEQVIYFSFVFVEHRSATREINTLFGMPSIFFSLFLCMNLLQQSIGACFYLRCLVVRVKRKQLIHFYLIPINSCRLPSKRFKSQFISLWIYSVLISIRLLINNNLLNKIQWIEFGALHHRFIVRCFVSSH